MILQLKKRKKISHKDIIGWLIGSLCGFCYFQPQFLSETSTLYYYVCNGTQFIFSILIILFFLIMLLRRRVKLLEFSHIFIWIAFSTILLIPNVTKQNMSTMLFLVSNLAILCSFIVFRAFNISVLQGCAFYLSLLVYINIITVFLFPEGLYNVGLARKFYFFGHANGMIKYVVPCIVLRATIDMLKKGKYSFNTIFIEILSLVVLIYTRTYTGLFGMLFLVFGQIVYYIRKKLPIIFTARIALFMSVLVFLIITSDFFLMCISFLAEVLERSYSISSRYVMWEQARKWISNSLFLGYGYITDYSGFLRIGNYFPSSAHNFFMDVMMNSGIMGFFCVLIFLWIIMNKIDAILNEKVRSQVIIGIWSILIMWNFEPWFSSLGLYSFMLIVAIVSVMKQKEFYEG